MMIPDDAEAVASRRTRPDARVVGDSPQAARVLFVRIEAIAVLGQYVLFERPTPNGPIEGFGKCRVSC